MPVEAGPSQNFSGEDLKFTKYRESEKVNFGLKTVNPAKHVMPEAEVHLFFTRVHIFAQRFTFS